MDRGAWQATDHGVEQSRTWLKQLTLSLFFSLSKRAHEIVVWRGKSIFTKKQFLHMIFQSSYSQEYSFLKKIWTQPTYLGYCLWSEKWPKPCWASISWLCSSHCQGPSRRSWVHFWPMDAWKRSSPIQTVIVSQVHCLTSHFSGKTDVGMFLVSLVRRIGFVCSSCWENLGSGMRGGRGETRKGCGQKGGGGHGEELPARPAGALYHEGQGPAPSLVPAALGSRLPP